MVLPGFLWVKSSVRNSRTRCVIKVIYIRDHYWIYRFWANPGGRVTVSPQVRITVSASNHRSRHRAPLRYSFHKRGANFIPYNAPKKA